MGGWIVINWHEIMADKYWSYVYAYWFCRISLWSFCSGSGFKTLISFSGKYSIHCRVADALYVEDSFGNCHCSCWVHNNKHCASASWFLACCSCKSPNEAKTTNKDSRKSAPFAIWQDRHITSWQTWINTFTWYWKALWQQRYHKTMSLLAYHSSGS